MGLFVHGRTQVVRAAFAVLLVAALATAGCGGGDDGGDAKRTPRAVTASKDGLSPVGKGRYAYARGLFNELCAGCHTLADAGATGQRFDLDVPKIEAAQVWNAIQNGEPGMPSWRERISSREISALATYVMSVAKGKDAGDDRWGTQIRRRIAGETARWTGISASIERQLDREGRKGEHASGRVVPPAAR